MKLFCKFWYKLAY